MTPHTGSRGRTAERLSVPVRCSLPRHPGRDDFTTDLALYRYRAVTDTPGSPRTAPPAGERPRLLAIHGFRGDHHGLQHIVDALPEYEVLVPDLPGFGETPPLRDGTGRRALHDLTAYADVVESLRLDLGLGARDIVLGHSFGTVVVAAHLTRRDPPWAGAALLCPISDDVFRMPLLPGAAAVEACYRLGELLPEAVGTGFLRSRAIVTAMNFAMGTSPEPAVRRFVADQHARYFGGFSDRATLLEAYRASSRNTVTQFAPDIRVPVHLIAGALDQVSTPSGQRALRDALPQGSLETIRGVGHLMHYEKPAEAARALRRVIACHSDLQ